MREAWARIQHGQPPTVQELAERFRFPVRSLSRLCQKEIGQSLRDYLYTLRMEKAAQSLRVDRSKSIEQVATEAGFTKQGAFSGAFREWSGQTPSAYRRGNL